MEQKIKIILDPKEHKSKNGIFFEELMKSVFSTQGYELTNNINFTGMEIDLLGKHNIREEILYVECKAKEKPKSTEIRNFIFNITHKNTDYGYFVYTEELDHQAAGLKKEIEENKEKYKNVSFFGPDKIIQALIISNKIKDFKSIPIRSMENISTVILAYTYFGIFYILLPFDGTQIKQFYLYNALDLTPITEIESIIGIYEIERRTIVSELKNSIKEIRNLELCVQIKSSIPRENNSIPIEIEYITDVPPNITKWVGRNKELNSIASDNFKVIFITGLGGQGKSSLASYYVQKSIIQTQYEFWDWRDCKEEDNRLHTKIISAIGRITGGNISLPTLSDLKTDELINTFFHYLGNRSIVFVFDNIDHYIDLEKFIPIGGIGKLFFEALEREHKSKFIFTCRPFIRSAAVGFYQIKLEGLSYKETEELFNSYNIPIKKEELNEILKYSHELTQGHPLWLNLIAAQAVMGKEKLKELIENIELNDILNETNITSILSEKILGVVWNTLSSKQKLLLRAMSEIVRAETELNLGLILERELNHNQFQKALKQLINLNLIVVKSSTGTQDLLDLHPLVKVFIKHRFLISERNRFISLIEQHYDKIIFILKAKLTENLPLSSYENWTHKIELEINKGELKNALTVLTEIYSPIIKAGFVEEYLRVADLLFMKIDWQTAINEEYSYFNTQLAYYIEIIIHFGKNESAEFNLTKYEKCISGKSSDYIILCSLRCYYHWFIGEFSKAIKWGEKGEYLLKSSNIDNDHSLLHHLALARRDSKNHKNIKIALRYFAGNKEIKEILNNPVDKEMSGSLYGNVGRCFHFLNHFDDALNCYKKSLLLLFDERSTQSVLNVGYACKWISEILLRKNELEIAIYFVKLGMLSWYKYAPPYGEQLANLFLSIKIDQKEKDRINALEDWQIEKFCKEWINN